MWLSRMMKAVMDKGWDHREGLIFLLIGLIASGLLAVCYRLHLCTSSIDNQDFVVIMGCILGKVV